MGKSYLSFVASMRIACAKPVSQCSHCTGSMHVPLPLLCLSSPQLSIPYFRCGGTSPCPECVLLRSHRVSMDICLVHGVALHHWHWMVRWFPSNIYHHTPSKIYLMYKIYHLQITYIYIYIYVNNHIYKYIKYIKYTKYTPRWGVNPWDVACLRLMLTATIRLWPLLPGTYS